MSEATQHLERALDTALEQYAETMGEAFPIVPLLDVIDDPDFWALAKMDGDIFRISVSTGTVASVTALWASAFSDEDFLESFGQAVDADAAEMTHISLVWLMLHEMHHFQMGHFGNLDPTHSSKPHDIDRLALVERMKKRGEPHSKTGMVENKLILEMQADHDATEMLLDAYSPDEWIPLRVRVAAISAMMMLIERSVASNQTHRATHPKAATRIFQLLGHLMDMPLIAAHSNLNQTSDGQSTMLPSKEEHERFAANVVLPAFFDALSLARTAKAQSIIDDLGNAAGFFQDIQIANLMSDTGSSEFVTAGARQWAELATKEKAKVL